MSASDLKRHVIKSHFFKRLCSFFFIIFVLLLKEDTQKTPGLEALKMSAPPLVAETKNARVPENQVKIENCCTDVTSKNCTRGSFGLITGVYQIMCFLQYLYQ